jgi:predicted Rossmann fold flavoprotein
MQELATAATILAMPGKRIAIVGGGAAGFFAAIACAEADPANEVSIYERGSQFLAKVRISGGGRCNVTHACFEPREFISQYPRGDRALISPIHRFSINDTIEWFENRGVPLKTEEDGRMFPVTDSSNTIVDCLIGAARTAGVQMFPRRVIERATVMEDKSFQLHGPGQLISCDRLLLAMGGCRAPGSVKLVESLAHSVLPPVPSLFSFHSPTSWLRSLPGISVAEAELTIPNTALRERGPLLITHQGISGPAVLRISAWGARILHELDYRFTLHINWSPQWSPDEFRNWLKEQRDSHPGRLIVNSRPHFLPARLWEQLALGADITRETVWAQLSRAQSNHLSRLITRTELEINGKSLNKDEFVTCGGVDLREVDFKTMQSKIVPGLFFAGELLDIDGITGGYNFQAAWTTGYIAGKSMASEL